ncbi:uncharacterized protein [Triticum aestivum]|uniref:uncharacterized protein isoform X2 n=1 Tax=Triticum aestivum TaxID=4565 RepID=UPI001D014A64|nr:uncharacterized protein LOC123185983 isoform X2 [Triticum aestivum]
MQQCHGKDKAATSAMPNHSKGTAAASAMPYHVKDKAATIAMQPKQVFADENIVQEPLAHPDRIRQRGLNRLPSLRGKEMADTRSSSLLSRKHLGKERSPSLSHKLKEKVDTGLIPHMHNAKVKMCPSDQFRHHIQGIQRPVKTESRLAREMSQKRREKVDTGPVPRKHGAMEKTCVSDQDMWPFKTEACLAGEMSQKRMEKVDTGSNPQKHHAMEKTCTSDQDMWPFKTEACLAGEMSQKRMEKVDTGSNPQKHNAKEKNQDMWPFKTEACLAREMSQRRMEKVDTGSNQQKHSAEKKTCPPDQLCPHTHGIQRKERLSVEKKHTKSNTSFPAKRTSPQLRTRTSYRCSDAGTGRPIDAHDHGNTGAIQEQKQVYAATQVDEDVGDIIQKLNELGLGEDIEFEEYYGYLQQLPPDPRVDTYTELNLEDYFNMDLRHAVYRIRSYKLLKKESNNELCCDELKECPMELLDREEFPTDFLVKMRYFSFFDNDGILDWFFDPDLCKLACVNDYQRLVPRKHSAYEYAGWVVYRGYLHSYEMQHEYIEYFETLLRELKWLKDCLPSKFSPLTVSKIRTRGIYQATKIATRFSKITTHLARIGFRDCFNYMSIEATWCNGSDGLYFEIWKRVTQQKESFRDSLKEVYKLNKCPSLQDSIKYAMEHDCSMMETAFLRCTVGAGITKEVPEDKAQELIAEAVEKLRIKPKFYDGYIRKKIDIAKAIGMITEDSSTDTLKDDYKLNKCPSFQHSIKYALEEDCSVREWMVSEDKAQELIAEAVKKPRIKPEFCDDISEKIEIAKPVGTITVE